jgi:nucleotide-binding universal stress UspA family protein
MLEKALAETDPVTTAVVVMTAKFVKPGTEDHEGLPDIDPYDQQLMTAVVGRAERAGKEVKPLIVRTNNPLHAVLSTAAKLKANEVIMGVSNKYTADEQLDQIAFYWISLHQGQTVPLTVRILGAERDLFLDLAGGNRIPKISERQARSVAELRAAGVGVDRVLMVHDGSSGGSDLFQAVLTMLDPQVALAIVPLVSASSSTPTANPFIQQDQERARHLGRQLSVLAINGEEGPDIVRLAREGQYDLIILGLPEEPPPGQKSRVDAQANYLLDHAHCRVFLAASPIIPNEVLDTRPST